MLRKLFDKTLLRFILVGIANTAFGSTVMFVFYNVFGFGYWFSSASNYVLGSILSFFLNKRFTFEDKSRGPGVFLRFAVNIASCYLIAYGLAKPFARWALSGLGTTAQENAAMAVGLCVFTGLNYLGQRFFAFKK